MGDAGELWTALREQAKRHKKKLYTLNVADLEAREKGGEIRVVQSGDHLKVALGSAARSTFAQLNLVDYWPTTGTAMYHGETRRKLTVDGLILWLKGLQSVDS